MLAFNPVLPNEIIADYNFMIFKSFTFLILLISYSQAATLASADFVNYADDPWAYSLGNTIGLSMDIGETIPYITNPLFKAYLLNSNLYGSWYNNFNVFLHNPGGYKYNCTLMSIVANQTLPCIFDMDNQTFMTDLGNFNWDVLMTYGLTVQWDNRGADFTDSDYMTYGFKEFAKTLRTKSYQSYFTATADAANTFNSTGIRPGYDFNQPAKDCADINMYIGYWYTSPGLTAAASKDWYQFSDIYYQCGIFTARATIFPDPSKLSIQNLLSQTYTSEFITNRFTVNGTSFVSSINYYYVSLSDVRLVQSYEGVDGLTNSFAAAIWAIQFTMEWIINTGFHMSYFNPIKNPSFQSILGQAPYFKPSAVYYGLLFVIAANNLSPWVMIPTVVSGTSSKIKAYGFDNYDEYGVLILNKDTSTSANGTVDVKISITTGLRCMYLSAPSLSSTEGISFNGYSFVSNSSVPVGEFVSKTYQVGSNGMYSIPLNYSQVAYCKTIVAKTYWAFPRYSATSSQVFLLSILFWCLLLLLQ